jgi:hypothetical protein
VGHERRRAIEFKFLLALDQHTPFLIVIAKANFISTMRKISYLISFIAVLCTILLASDAPDC